MTSPRSNKSTWHAKKPLLWAAVALAILALTSGVAMSLDRVGDSLVNQGHFAQAIPFYEVATATQKSMGIQNQRSANAWTELGICYAHELRNADALRVQIVAIEMRRNLSLRDPELRLANHQWSP